MDGEKTMSYIVRAKVRPDLKIINKEYPHENREDAMKHVRLLKKQGWKADILLVDES